MADRLRGVRNTASDGARRAIEWSRARPRTAGALAIVAVVVIVAGGVGAWQALGGPGSPPAASAAVEVTPSGVEAPRLSPIVVRFPRKPADDRGEQLISVQPTVTGNFAWLDERTLLFQPAFPGLLRGQQYSVRVDAASAGLSEDVTQTFTVAGKLTVDHVIPGDGSIDVPAEARILVQFSRSVAPLTVLSAQAAAPVLEFDPPLAGTGEWLNTALYQFTPTDLKPSTAYRVRIAAGLTSEADGVLEADYVWSFTGYRPAITRATPEDNTRFVPLDQPVTLTFNQPMQRVSVENGLSITEAAGNTVGGAFAWSEGDTVVTFTPAQRWSLSTRYVVTAPSGLAAAETGATPSERTFAFTTVDSPRVITTSPADGEREAGRFGISITFNNPVDVESVEARLSVSGIDRADLVIDTWDPSNFFIQTQLSPSTRYTVALAAGAFDRSGLAIPAMSFTFTTGALPPSISFAVSSPLATYASATEPVLYARVTNLAEARFALYPLTRDEANQLLDLNSFPQAGARAWLPAGAPIREWAEPVAAAQNGSALIATSLTGGGPLPAGDYYVVSTNGAVFSQLMVSVVDVAIVTKLSQNELLTWVLDYVSGAPLANVTVQGSGPGLAANATAQTDASGLATFAVPGPREVTNRERWYGVRAAGTGRSGVASTRWQTGSEPWQLNIPPDYWQRSYVAYLYTDRPLYRSGETVHYRGVVRTDNDARYEVPSPAPQLEIVIRDPQYNELSRQAVTLNDFGTFAADFALPAGAATGGYVMELRTLLDREGAYDYLGGASFLVAEFRRPEFEVAVATDRDDYVTGAAIAATTSAHFFFGGAVSGAPVQWSVLSSPAFVSAPDFPEYSFTDFDETRSADPSDPLRGEGTATTGSDGVARFSVPAALQGSEGAQRFDVGATVIDENQQAVAGSTSVTVHPADYYAGVMTESYLAFTGEATSIRVATIDTGGVALPNRAVVVRVYEREWITTKQSTADGGRHYVSEPRDTLTATLRATTGADATAAVSYTPEGPGTLRIVAEATDAAGRTARASTFLWVAGSEFASWQVRNDDVLPLIADRAQYEVGDVAQVLVPAQFAGMRALVTIERGTIMSRSLRTLATTSETLSIPIEDAHLPNVFVGVVLYRPPTAEDPVPRYQVGYVELKVSTAPRRLTVTVEPSAEQVAPGERVDFRVHVADSAGRPARAEFSIAVVDRAVLSLASELGPDGLAAFWFERGLAVQTASSLSVSIDRSNDAIPESEVDGKGGGADDRLRQNFQNTAYWAGQVETDANGDATVSVVMPDNLTSWCADVRAVGEGTRVGHATAEVTVTQPLLLRPALPRFLRVGDQSTLRVLVRNATATAADVTVTLRAAGLEVSGDTTRHASIAPDTSATLEWPARATAAGTARLTFGATAAEMSDAVTIELPVLVDLTPETTATGGVLEQAATAEAIYLPDYAILDGGSLDVRVQGSLVGTLDQELEALKPRAYETTEHVASRVIATLGARRASGDPLVDARISADVATLVGAQRLEGGWGWCGDCPVDPAVSAWVLIALGEARAAGQGIDSNALFRASLYLLDQLDQPSDVAAPADPNERAYVLAAVARGARVEPGESLAGTPLAEFDGRAQTMLRALIEQRRSELAGWGRAYALLGLAAAAGDDNTNAIQALVTDLSSTAITSANGAHWEDEVTAPGRWPIAVMQSNVRTTALVVEALSVVDAEHPLLDEAVRWLTRARSTNDWATDLQRAQGVVALGRYAEATGDTAGDYRYSVRLDGDALLDGRFARSEHVRTADVSVPLSRLTLGGVSKLDVIKDGNGRLYYGVDLRYLTPAAGAEAVNRGLAVSHEYTLLEAPGQSIAEARLGDVIRVRVTVVAPADRHFVQVSDLLPAGFEPVDTSLRITPIELRAQLGAERIAIATAGSPAGMAPWYAWYYSPWEQVDVRDDSVVLYATALPAGVHEYVYYVRATSAGDYFVAPAHAEEAYSPDVFGRSDSARFTVR